MAPWRKVVEDSNADRARKSATAPFRDDPPNQRRKREALALRRVVQSVPEVRLERDRSLVSGGGERVLNGLHACGSASGGSRRRPSRRVSSKRLSASARSRSCFRRPNLRR